MIGAAIGLGQPRPEGLSLHYQVNTQSGSKTGANQVYAGVPNAESSGDYVSGVRFWLEGEHRELYDIQYIVTLSNGSVAHQANAEWAGIEPNLAILGLDASVIPRR